MAEPQAHAPDPDTTEADAQRLKIEVSRVLDELESHGLLNDQRAADALLQAKAARYGSRRLKQMLQARSLDAELVASSLRQTRDSEFERAHEVWRRRFGTPATDLRERARQQRFLAARGFEAAVIDRVMKAARLDSASPPRPEPDLDEG